MKITVLQCPVCGTTLTPTTDGLYCSPCQTFYGLVQSDLSFDPDFHNDDWHVGPEIQPE